MDTADLSDTPTARTLWLHLETINAVAYFSEECRAAPAELGLKGFWMGYFGCRAAPMGAVPPAVVEATFFNFNAERVRRAIPDAWDLATPADLVRARSAAAAAAIRRLLGSAAAEELAAQVTPTLYGVIEASDAAGRPLFAANRDVARPDDPVEAMWQAGTTIREHRGDGHVALVVGAGIDGCEVHVLQSDGKAIDPAVFQASRGWSPEDWQAATERLAGRGLVTDSGRLTDAGRALVEDLERRTDDLASRPLDAIGGSAVEHVLRCLGPASVRIAAAGEISYPNPMGLPSSA